MTPLLECSKCGGLLPSGRTCCPHCHCSYSPAKRALLAAAAAIGVASCGGTQPVAMPLYGGFHGGPVDEPDASVVDANPVDAAKPDVDGGE